MGIDDWEPQGVDEPDSRVIELDGENKSEQDILAEAILSTYRIESDDAALRENTHMFEKLRGDYPVRREFDFYSLRATNVPARLKDKLEVLGFELLDH